MTFLWLYLFNVYVRLRVGSNMLFTIYNVLSGTLIFVTGLIYHHYYCLYLFCLFSHKTYICFISYVENSGRALSHWRSTYRRGKSANNTMLEHLLNSLKRADCQRLSDISDFNDLKLCIFGNTKDFLNNNIIP